MSRCTKRKQTKEFDKIVRKIVENNQGLLKNNIQFVTLSLS